MKVRVYFCKEPDIEIIITDSDELYDIENQILS
jgi:hypothetical protein